MERMLKLWIPVLLAQILHGQTGPATPTAEPSVTFQSKTTLVPVPVIVRDKQSHAIGNLTQDNFQVFDNGKLQTITRFSLEKAGVLEGREPTPVVARSGVPLASVARELAAIPDHFVGYVFDDLHFQMSDLVQARLAALKHFDGLEMGTSRAAVFTTSGVKPEDFTSDRARLKAALNGLTRRSMAGTPQTECPYLSYYTADLIANRDDPMALQSAVAAAMQCPVAMPPSMVQNLVRSAARQAASVGETETRITLSVLRTLVKRMSALPGQRTLILVSPGFLFPSHEQEISELIDLAVRMNVVVNTIDSRGLYVDGQYDASRGTVSDGLFAYEREDARDSALTLGVLAEGTGGTAFANNNDLLAGFRRSGSQPEFSYVLGFSPQNLKNDGKFHSIKVKLKDSSGLNVQARRGYYAPKHNVDPADQAKQDIDDALFSRQDISNFPLAIKLQTDKGTAKLPTLIVLTHLGLKTFRFRKSDGVSSDKLTLVAGLFDDNGKYLRAIESSVDQHYKDETLEARVQAGVTIKTTFPDVKPGSYLVRLVARESEGQMISAVNGTVEVP